MANHIISVQVVQGLGKPTPQKPNNPVRKFKNITLQKLSFKQLIHFTHFSCIWNLKWSETSHRIMQLINANRWLYIQLIYWPLDQTMAFNNCLPASIKGHTKEGQFLQVLSNYMFLSFHSEIYIIVQLPKFWLKDIVAASIFVSKIFQPF